MTFKIWEILALRQIIFIWVVCRIQNWTVLLQIVPSRKGDLQNQCYTNTQGNSSGGRLHLMSLTTPFNKGENFASFRSKIWQRKGSRGRARILFTSFTSFGLGRSAPQKERETFSRVFPPSSIFCFFVPFLFYFGGRLAGLSMAHICSSSPLVFTAAAGLLPPRLMDRKRKKGWDGSREGSSCWVRSGRECAVPLRVVSHSSVWESLCKLNETVIPIELL